MGQGRYTRCDRPGRKSMILLLALILIIGIVVGGTLAWLTDTTDTVTNVFKTSGINIMLTEENPRLDTEQKREVQILPGYTILKDPKVTVTKDSEKCFLFVTVKETNWPEFLEQDSSTRKVNYTVITGDNGWNKLEASQSGAPAGTTVYYRVVEKGTADQEFYILKDNKVTVSPNLTSAEMNEVTNEFTLEFAAFACQYYKDNNTSTENTSGDGTGTPFTPAEAWDNCKPSGFGK